MRTRAFSGEARLSVATPCAPVGSPGSPVPSPGGTPVQVGPEPTTASGGPIRFQLLGPVRMLGSRGDLLAGSSPIQRSIAAALMLQPSVPVTVSELVDWLWDDNPPSTYRNQLHLHISRLRAALRGDERLASRLVSRRTAYLLEMDRSESDVGAFRQLRAEGRRYTAAHDPPRAGRVLRDALALWRAAPLIGTRQTSALLAEVSRLEEERLDTTEQRVAADLLAGGHDGLVAELRALLARHPLRERLHELLMGALYREGRRGEALAAYTAARATLVEELGIEPGPGLRSTHRMVLRGDLPPATPAPGTGNAAPDPTGTGNAAPHPTGTTRPAGAPASRAVRRSVPAELPPSVAAFTGRAQQLRRMVDALRAADPEHLVVVAVNGLGGTGKSALAVRAAHQARDRFPDGQLYVDLGGDDPAGVPVPPRAALARLLRGLGTPEGEIPAGTAEAAGRLRSLLAGRRVLVVLDNAHDSAQVRDLLPGAGPAAAIVTSRSQLGALDGAHHVRLGLLPPAEAVALLSQFIDDPRVAVEPEHAARIARLCGYLPLGLRIAGARIASRPDWDLATFASRLADRRHRLDELCLEDLAVRTSFQASYAGIAGDAGSDRSRQAFHAAGRLDTAEVATDDVAGMLGCSAGEADAAFAGLVDARLVEPAGPGRYRMHELVRLFARERADQEAPAGGDRGR